MSPLDFQLSLIKTTCRLNWVVYTMLIFSFKLLIFNKTCKLKFTLTSTPLIMIKSHQSVPKKTCLSKYKKYWLLTTSFNCWSWPRWPQRFVPFSICFNGSIRRQIDEKPILKPHRKRKLLKNHHNPDLVRKILNKNHN